jgi:hypothetical protein
MFFWHILACCVHLMKLLCTKFVGTNPSYMRPWHKDRRNSSVLKNIGHIKLPQTNLKKDLLRDNETAFCSVLALVVLEKIFKDLDIFQDFGLKARSDIHHFCNVTVM